MGWSQPQQYACEECAGEGVVECCCCDSEIDCEDCNGSGLDDAKIDVKAFSEAEAAMLKETGSTWGWYEDGVCKGRMNNKTKLAYDDFKRIVKV